ncbi:MAG: endonuclease/exonuclease/phosphatase family protein [Actinomycetota bacterium]
MRVRVLVYNARGFRAGAGDVAKAVADTAPDLALITECGSRRHLRKFARGMDMEYSAGSLFPFARRVRNAILARPPWRVVTHKVHAFERSERFYPRGALVAQVGRAGYRLSALCVHLGLSSGERDRHAKELGDLTRGLTQPLVIGGDFNEGTEGRAVSWIGERYWDVWIRAGTDTGETFPSRDPTARIDYLFVSEEVRIESAAVVRSRGVEDASDHLPLVADLDLDA